MLFSLDCERRHGRRRGGRRLGCHLFSVGRKRGGEGADRGVGVGRDFGEPRGLSETGLDSGLSVVQREKLPFSRTSFYLLSPFPKKQRGR